MRETECDDAALLNWGGFEVAELSDFDGDAEWTSPEEYVEEPSPIVWPGQSLSVATFGLETMAPGSGLAHRLADTEHSRLDDDGLLDAIAAWRRLASWAKAGELAAVAAFMDRAAVAGPAHPSVGVDRLDQAAAQIQTALHLTGRATDALVDMAGALSQALPGTQAALAAGMIDEARAQVITRSTGVLPDVEAFR